MRNFITFALFTILSRNEYLRKKTFKIFFVILLHIYRLRLYASEIFRTPLDPQSLATEVAGLPRNVVMGRTRTAR